jgi:NADPH-dependent curcumin reductase CurA
VNGNLQVLLASRPKDAIDESNFRIVETAIPPVGPGELLVRNIWLSLDPYMRGRMSAEKSYAASVEVGEVMTGGAVGQVVESRHPGFKAGDDVVGALGWQRYALSRGTGLSIIEPGPVPLSAYLGVCGMPGATAYIGLFEHCSPRAGETVLVSAASGAVGGVVGQLAKIAGCRAIGIAGGAAKCDFATGELGFDACIDYQAGGLPERLREACPAGVDCLFENVGGAVMDAALELLNPFARIALCGLIADYNTTDPRGMKRVRSLLVNRVRLQGFIVSDHPRLYQTAVKRLAQWVAEGRLKYRESITEGLSNAPRALIGLFKGENFGKQLIKLE